MSLDRVNVTFRNPRALRLQKQSRVVLGLAVLLLTLGLVLWLVPRVTGDQPVPTVVVPLGDWEANRPTSVQVEGFARSVIAWKIQQERYRMDEPLTADELLTALSVEGGSETLRESLTPTLSDWMNLSVNADVWDGRPWLVEPAQPLPATYEPAIAFLVQQALADHASFTEAERSSLLAANATVRAARVWTWVTWGALLVGLVVLAESLRRRRLSHSYRRLTVVVDRHWATVQGARFSLEQPGALLARLKDLQDQGFVTQDLPSLLESIQARTRAMDGVDDPDARGRLRELLAKA